LIHTDKDSEWRESEYILIFRRTCNNEKRGHGRN